MWRESKGKIIKEHVCITQRAALGTQSCTRTQLFRSAMQSCAHGAAAVLTRATSSKGTRLQHTNIHQSLLMPTLIPPPEMAVRCSTRTPLSAPSKHWVTPIALHGTTHVSHIRWKSSTALLSDYRSCLTRAFVPRLTSWTSTSPIPISDLSTVLVFAIPLCIVSD